MNVCDGAVPAAIGPYRIERRLGSGGMGEVYLARDVRLGRQVALKRLRRDREDSASRRRLRREARAVACLSHPSIVPLFDFLELEDGDWLVLEHVDGPSLAGLLRDGGPLGLSQVLTYGRQLAEGLAAAHEQGIVHRDLKAENVLVAAGRARILDFGLVRSLEADEESLTHSGAVLGTIRAMSPEQAQGLPVGPRSDLFSLGVLLYEMLTGRSPFLAESPAETLSRIVGRPPEPLPPKVPAELASLVFQLLEKMPELRPADATAVACRLERLATRLPVDEAAPYGEAGEGTEVSVAGLESDPGSTGEDVPERRRPPWMAWGAALGVALGIAASIVFLGRASDTSSAPEVGTLVPGAAAAFDEEAWSLLARSDLEGNTDRAIDLFQRWIEVAPNSSRAHAGLARAYYCKLLQDSGDRMWLHQALSVARHAVELDGKDVEARVSLGLALIQDGRTEEARSELERILTLDPENADAYRGLAEIELKAGRLDEAEVAFRRALEIRPDDRELYEFLGTLYFRAGRLDEAEALFRDSIRVAPDSAQGYRNLAGIHIARGELEEASKVLARALKIQPTATLYLNQGTVFFFQGLYPQAAAAYESALGFPYGANLHSAWANLGDAWRQIPHRWHQAPEAFREAIRLLAPEVERKSDKSWLRSQLALYRAKAGQKEEALRDVDAVRPGDARTSFRLAVACEVLGERERALAFLAQALAEGFRPSEVEREPELLALRSDPRYHRLRASAGP